MLSGGPKAPVGCCDCGARFAPQAPPARSNPPACSNSSVEVWRFTVRKILLTTLAVLLLGHTAYLHGQVARATITGIVRDGTGAVVPGVSVKARHVETGVFYDAATNEVGAYTIGALP